MCLPDLKSDSYVEKAIRDKAVVNGFLFTVTSELLGLLLSVSAWTPLQEWQHVVSYFPDSDCSWPAYLNSDWSSICLITASLLGDLNCWLNLSTITKPTLFFFLRCSGSASLLARWWSCLPQCDSWLLAHHPLLSSLRYLACFLPSRIMNLQRVKNKFLR